MGNQITRSVVIDDYDVANHCDDAPEFFAEVINRLGEYPGLPDEWLRELVASLNAEGETALRAIVAWLDQIDAASSEGR